MQDFSINVNVSDVSHHLYFSMNLADFEAEEMGIAGRVSVSGDAVLFVINECQYKVSITEMLHKIYNHTKEA